APQLATQHHAVHTRHHDVQNDQIRASEHDFLPRLTTRTGLSDLIAFLTEQSGHGPQQVWFVVYCKNKCLWHFLCVPLSHQTFCPCSSLPGIAFSRLERAPGPYSARSISPPSTDRASLLDTSMPQHYTAETR